MLRQRSHRILLGQNANRATQPETLANPDRAGERDLRVPRDLPQPSAAPLGPRYADSDRIRDDATTRPTRGLKSSIPTPRNRGHIISTGSRAVQGPSANRLTTPIHRYISTSSVQFLARRRPGSTPSAPAFGRHRDDGSGPTLRRPARADEVDHDAFHGLPDSARPTGSFEAR